MISDIFILKLIITIAFVLLLSLLAEYLSPKISGIISGIPTGTALILFFYGLEYGEDFAVKSSLFNLVGMVGLHFFIYIYYKTSNIENRFDKLISSIAAIIGYVICISILYNFKINIFIAIIVPLISIFVFNHLFRKIRDSKIEKRIKLSPYIILIRSLVASFAILLITTIAYIIGPTWAGLFSSFPTTLFPLMLIIHNTYGKKQLHTILKYVPKSQISVIIYVISIYFLYPLIGIYLGTLISYSFVIIYLIVLFKLEQKDG